MIRAFERLASTSTSTTHAGWTFRPGLRASLSAFDRILRRRYGVQEFSRADGCVLRLGVEPMAQPRRLLDGTVLQPGDTVGVLHIWNERLPAFGERGPDLHWAKVMKTRMRFSIDELAKAAQTDARWRSVKAFHGEAGFGGPLGHEQMRRVAPGWGFEVHPYEAPPLRRLHDVGQNALIWTMVGVFNPGALRRHKFWISRYELWISRRSLLQNYGERRAAGHPDAEATVYAA